MKKNPNINEIQRIFISSTYEDMQEYRKAAIDALTSIEQLPVSMEHFVAATDTSLDVCLANVRRCQMVILLIGMKYGSVDANTGKSYTELEYDEALRNNIPVLSFIIDEKSCPILPIYVDTDDKAPKLKAFKKRLKEKQIAYFSSSQDLKNQIVQAVTKHFEAEVQERDSQNKQKPNDDAYIEGAKAYRKFLMVPERLKNSEILLRVRMDGIFSDSFRRRNELFEAYGLKKGDTVIAENVIPIGINLEDISEDAVYMDLYAEGKNADWLIDNGVTTGVIFEGKFRLAYELVEGAGGDRAHSKPIAVKLPALILVNGLAVTGKSEKGKYPVRRKSTRNRLSELEQSTLNQLNNLFGN